MTSKSGFFVFILIASGCLSKACGDGEISTSPRSSEGAPTPDQSDVDEPASGVKGAPYVYVTLADMGITIGPGVIAPYPTVAYTGPCTITTPGTVIENRIITCSTLEADADNITIRNSVVNLTNTDSGGNGIRLGRTNRSANGFTIEYSYVNYLNPNGKILNAFGGPFRDFVIRNSHVEGGFDFFDMEGDLDGMIVEYNVLGPLGCKTDVTQHSDGFQLGTPAYPTAGVAIVRGNQVLTESGCGKTTFFWNATGSMRGIIESNNIPIWGATTLWSDDNDGQGAMDVRYNVYTSEFQAAVGNRCGGGGCGSVGQPECCYWPLAAAVWTEESATRSSAECNRYEDGSFVEDEYMSRVTHKITGCPDYP